MNGLSNYFNENVLGDLGIYSMQYNDEIFKALVDVIIPRTPVLAEEYGRIQYYGALDLYTDEYLIISLNSLSVPIAEPTAELLELAAQQYLFTEGAGSNGDLESAEWSTFGALSPKERLQVLTLLEQAQVDAADLPVPFRDNQTYVRNIVGALGRSTLMGYYSEWSGYGSTRMDPPNQRSLEYFPISWVQVGYPGPSLGYRSLRVNNSGQSNL